MTNQKENPSNSDLNTVILQYSSYQDIDKNRVDSDTILATDKGYQSAMR